MKVPDLKRLVLPTKAFQPRPGDSDQPFTIPQLINYPGGNIHGFSVVLDNSPGSLFSYLKEIAQSEWNVVAISASAPPTAEQVSVYLVVDFTKTEEGPEDFVSMASAVPSARSVEHIEPLAIGLIADTSHFPLQIGFGGRRGFIFGDALLQSLFESSYERMGVDATKTFLYRLGFDFGKRSSKWAMGELHYTGEDAVRVLLRQGKALGWWSGMGEADLQRRLLRLKLWQNWEGQYTRQGVGCQAVRGFWDGSVSDIMGRTVQFEEVACISRRSEYCEFRLMA